MKLIKEIKANTFPVKSVTPKFKCQVFEDNKGPLEMATNHKFRPRTEHLCVKLHHFRDYVSRGEIIAEKINIAL